MRRNGKNRGTNRRMGPLPRRCAGRAKALAVPGPGAPVRTQHLGVQRGEDA